MPAYVIAQINVKHKEGFRAYAEKVPQTIKNFGGKYLVRAGTCAEVLGAHLVKRGQPEDML